MAAISDTAELIVTELVTNVVLAPPGERAPVFQVGLFSDRQVLVVEVFDTLPGTPERRDTSAEDEHGRGLAIVEALSEEWGTRPHPRGKVVYVRVRAA
jgi:anti-sigma regulatory factor (Ser/Thr protein kinase)